MVTEFLMAVELSAQIKVEHHERAVWPHHFDAGRGLRAVDSAFVERLRELVGGVEVDLDAPLSADDE